MKPQPPASSSRMALSLSPASSEVGPAAGRENSSLPHLAFQPHTVPYTCDPVREGEEGGRKRWMERRQKLQLRRKEREKAVERGRIHTCTCAWRAGTNMSILTSDLS